MRVYLVGGGTHPGSGLPVIYEGARDQRTGCCRRICDEWRGFRQLPPSSRLRCKPSADERWSRAGGIRALVPWRESARRQNPLVTGEATHGHRMWLSSAAGWAGCPRPRSRRRAGIKRDAARQEPLAWRQGGGTATCRCAGWWRRSSASTWVPTILTVPRVLRRIYAEAGRDQAQRPALMLRLDPQWRCFFDDDTQHRPGRGCGRDGAVHGRLRARHRAGRGLSQPSRSVAARPARASREKFFFWKSVEGLTDTIDFRSRTSTLGRCGTCWRCAWAGPWRR